MGSSQNLIYMSFFRVEHEHAALRCNRSYRNKNGMVPEYPGWSAFSPLDGGTLQHEPDFGDPFRKVRLTILALSRERRGPTFFSSALFIARGLSAATFCCRG